jgi:hypothetical protein
LDVEAVLAFSAVVVLFAFPFPFPLAAPFDEVDWLNARNVMERNGTRTDVRTRLNMVIERSTAAPGKGTTEHREIVESVVSQRDKSQSRCKFEAFEPSEK